MRPFLASALALAAAAPAATAQQLVWLQTSDGYSTVESAEWSAPAPKDVLAADDFEFAGDVTRVIAHGYKDFHATGTLAIDGVWVRFYADDGGSPGEMEYELFVPEGAPGFVHGEYPVKLDVTLPLPFAASGRHFVSVQLVTPEAHQWRWWSSSTLSPDGGSAHVKDELAGGGWQTYTNVLGQVSDLAFELWGDDGTVVPDPTDPCGEWEELATPELPANYDTTILRDVVVLGNDDAWAVGNPSVEVQYLNWEYKNYALHWDGDDWTEIPTPNPGVMPSPFQATGLRAVDASGPEDVWAVGHWERQDSYGFIVTQPLVLVWDGGDWEHRIVPNTNFDTSTYDVKVFGPDDAWIIGGGFSPLSIHWDGSGFELVDVPDFGVGGGTPGFEFEAADGVASDDLWAVGGGSDGDFSGTTFIAHWDGSEWEYVPGPEPGFSRRLFDVHAIASDDVWAVGQYQELVGQSVKYFAWAIHWDGTSWELYDGANEPVGSLAVHAFGPDEVYSAGGGIYRFDGTSWSLADDLGQNTGENISVSIAGLDAAEPCHLFAVGRQDVGGALVPFSARQQGPNVWATSEDGCEDAPGLPDGIALVSGPKLGTPFTVAIGDPNGLSAYPPGVAQTFWMVSLGVLPGACGVPIPGTGLGGSAAALLIDPAQLVGLTGPVVWGGIDDPALHSVPVPPNPALNGFEVHTQGLLVDPGTGGTLLTDALHAKLGL